ncbi:MAG: dTMP kinase [Pseudomonadota bacterium]
MDGATAPHGKLRLNRARLARLVTFEGGEGAGKTTQILALAAHLEAHGQEVTTTREPGGTPGAEAVRQLFVDGDVDRWSPRSELFLLLAARLDHLERTIRPALAAGAWVLCDRYWDSTRVYQGRLGGLGDGEIVDLHDRWLEPFCPEMTLLLDVDVEVGLARAAAGRFEAKGMAFHRTVREAFHEFAGLEPDRFTTIDAGGDVADVKAAVITAFSAKYPRLPAP